CLHGVRRHAPPGMEPRSCRLCDRRFEDYAALNQSLHLIFKPVGAAGAADTPGATTSVMLCGGTVTVVVDAAKPTSERRPSGLAAGSCQLCPAPVPANEPAFTVPGVDPVEFLQTIITVNAPSDDRTAANAATRSGFGTVTATLTSPNVDRLP